MDRPVARLADHPDLAVGRGARLARLARRIDQSAALCGDAARHALGPAAYAAAARAALAPGDRIASIRYPEHGRGDRRRRAPGRGTSRAHQCLARSGERPGARQGLGRCRPGPLHPRPPRQPRRPRHRADDRRLGRHLHVLLVPDRPVAVVADHRQPEARLALEAAEFGQRQPPPSGRLLGAAAAGDAELHRRLDLLPRPVRRRRAGAPPAGARAAAGADRRSPPIGRCRRRSGSPPAPSSASPGRPTNPANGKSPSRATAVRPKSRSTTPPARPRRRARRGPRPAPG